MCNHKTLHCCRKRNIPVNSSGFQVQADLHSRIPPLNENCLQIETLTYTTVRFVAYALAKLQSLLLKCLVKFLFQLARKAGWLYHDTDEWSLIR